MMLSGGAHRYRGGRGAGAERVVLLTFHHSCSVPSGGVQMRFQSKGFSLVEIVTSCPTNWGLDPLESLDFLEEKMLKEFPLGVIRDKSREEA